MNGDPQYDLGEKIGSMEARLKALEEGQDAIMRELQAFRGRFYGTIALVTTLGLAAGYFLSWIH